MADCPNLNIEPLLKIHQIMDIGSEKNNSHNGEDLNKITLCLRGSGGHDPFCRDERNVIISMKICLGSCGDEEDTI